MFYRWVSAPSYAVLYSGIESKDASDVTTKLSADGVPYKLTGNGSTVEVPTGSWTRSGSRSARPACRRAAPAAGRPSTRRG